MECSASAPLFGILSFYIPTNYDSSPLEVSKLAGSVSQLVMWFVGLPLINEWELCFQSIPKFDTRSFYIPTRKILTPLCPLQYVYIDPRFIRSQKDVVTSDGKMDAVTNETIPYCEDTRPSVMGWY